MEGPQAMRGMTPVLSHLPPALLTVLESSWRVAAPGSCRVFGQPMGGNRAPAFCTTFPAPDFSGHSTGFCGQTDHIGITKKTAPPASIFLNDFFMIGEILSGNFSTVPLMFR
jgi:hypothetical protein